MTEEIEITSSYGWTKVFIVPTEVAENLKSLLRDGYKLAVIDYDDHTILLPVKQNAECN